MRPRSWVGLGVCAITLALGIQALRRPPSVEADVPSPLPRPGEPPSAPPPAAEPPEPVPSPAPPRTVAASPPPREAPPSPLTPEQALGSLSTALAGLPAGSFQQDKAARQALRALQALPGADQALVAILLDGLGEAGQREILSKLLVLRDPAALHRLLTVLPSLPGDVRGQALAVAAHTFGGHWEGPGTPAWAAEPALVEPLLRLAAAEGDPGIRRMALEGLAATGDPRAKDALLSLTQDAQFREVAIQALGAYADDDEALLARLNGWALSGPVPQRLAALKALRRVADRPERPAALERLLTSIARDDPDVRIRAEAERALGQAR